MVEEPGNEEWGVRERMCIRIAVYTYDGHPCCIQCRRKMIEGGDFEAKDFERLPLKKVE